MSCIEVKNKIIIFYPTARLFVVNLDRWTDFHKWVSQHTRTRPTPISPVVNAITTCTYLRAFGGDLFLPIWNLHLQCVRVTIIYALYDEQAYFILYVYIGRMHQNSSGQLRGDAVVRSVLLLYCDRKQNTYIQYLLRIGASKNKKNYIVGKLLLALKRLVASVCKSIAEEEERRKSSGAGVIETNVYVSSRRCRFVYDFQPISRRLISDGMNTLCTTSIFLRVNKT